jgi:hypothetical protein
VFVVALAEFCERFGQFFQGLAVPHPEKLHLEGAEEAFDTAVAFGRVGDVRFFVGGGGSPELVYFKRCG